MKEVTYEEWQKNPTPRMMWVWDDDESKKKKYKVIYILSEEEAPVSPMTAMFGDINFNAPPAAPPKRDMSSIMGLYGQPPAASGRFHPACSQCHCPACQSAPSGSQSDQAAGISAAQAAA